MSKPSGMYMKSSGISVYCLTINVHIYEKIIWAIYSTMRFWKTLKPSYWKTGTKPNNIINQNNIFITSIRPPDRLFTPHGETRPFYIIGQCCDNIAVLGHRVELLILSIVEAAGLERTTVVEWRRWRRWQVGGGLGGVGEGRQVMHSGTWSEGGAQRGHLAQKWGLAGPERGGEWSAIWSEETASWAYSPQGETRK